MSMIVRFANTGRQPDDMEMVMHGNMTVGCLRKQILRKLKAIANNLKVELYANGEMLDPIDDRRLISEIPAIKDKSVSTRCENLLYPGIDDFDSIFFHIL